MIQEVVRRKLCTQCGFCAALCPASAIRVEVDRWANRFPVVDDKLCTRCGLCYEICSGRAINLAAIPPGHGRKVAPAGNAGSCRSVWTGHDSDNTRRLNAASGGLATAIAAGLLEKGTVERVLTVRASARDPFSPEAILTSDPAEVRRSSGSWYLPVNLVPAVRLLDTSPGPAAVIGLPCHLHAWRKATAKLPRLSRKIEFSIGLFCDHLVDARFHCLLMRAFGIDPDKVTAIGPRGRGWPGGVEVTLSDGTTRTLSYGHPTRKLLWKLYFFTPRRCLFCPDALAELADVSVGDAWLPEFSRDRTGTGLLMVRSARGERVIREMTAEGRLVLEPLDESKVAGAQRIQLKMKKELIGSRFRLSRMAGGEVPEFGLMFPHTGAVGYLTGAMALTLRALSARSWFPRAAGMLPWRTLGALFGAARGEKLREEEPQ